MFNSIRTRLTLWYLLVFGSLLVGFSTYIDSSLSSDLRKQYDVSLLRTARATATYFSEFVERKNVAQGARETILEMKLEKLSAAIFQDNQLLAASSDDITTAIVSARVQPAPPQGQAPTFATDSKMNKRLVVLPFQAEGGDYTVALLGSLDELSGQIGRIRSIILFGLPAALLLAAAGGFLVARKSLEPVITISEQAERIGAKNLHERLTVGNPNDEIGRLAGIFNAMLARLDTSFRVMREFMADASHELRTPLAIVQGEADVTLSREKTVDEYKQSLAIVRRQAKRMARIVSDMLSLARADAGEQHLRLEELYLNDLVEDCCHAAQALADPKGVRLTWEAGEDISFRGDEELLKRMAVNLLDNAIHYTQPGGAVNVKLKREQSLARLIISDTGIGIPPECVGRVFDRFYRVDKSRARAGGGSGLGLSIVRLAAESHHGSVDVVSQPGQGSTFTVCLPLQGY
jgi:heavy metal sensor kinase